MVRSLLRVERENGKTHGNLVYASFDRTTMGKDNRVVFVQDSSQAVVVQLGQQSINRNNGFEQKGTDDHETDC